MDFIIQKILVFGIDSSFELWILSCLAPRDQHSVGIGMRSFATKTNLMLQNCCYELRICIEHTHFENVSFVRWQCTLLFECSTHNRIRISNILFFPKFSTKVQIKNIEATENLKQFSVNFFLFHVELFQRYFFCDTMEYVYKVWQSTTYEISNISNNKTDNK